MAIDANGVLVAGADENLDRALLWWGTELPPMTGPDAVVSRVERSWAQDGCLVVTGRVFPEMIEVSEILSDCS